MGSQGMTGGIKIVSEANLGSFGEITATRTTNTFTPTTLKNIEQMFLDAEEPEDYKNAAGFAPPIVRKTYINMDTSNWQQGGVTTVVSPGPGSGPSFEILQPGKEEEKRVSRGGGRKPRDQEEEVLCPEEEERRRLRRERNKLAAARCRKRRVDQTDSLQSQVDSWEEKKRLLQAEIHALQTQREELQFILDTHKSVCTRQQSQLINNPTTTCTINRPTASLPNNNTSITNNNTIANTTAACIAQTSRQQHVLSVPKVVVKCEQQNQQQPNAVVTDSSSVDLQYLVNHLTHEEALNMPL